MAKVQEFVVRSTRWRALRHDRGYVADCRPHCGGPPPLDAAPFPVRVQTRADLGAVRWGRERKDRGVRPGSAGAGMGDRRRHDRSRHRAGASAWDRCAREQAELSCRRRTLTLRKTRHPGACRADRRSDGGLQRARSGSIRPHCGGMPARRPGRNYVAGRSGLGAGVPAVFAGVCELRSHRREHRAGEYGAASSCRLGIGAGASACRVPVGRRPGPRKVLRAVAGPRETSATPAANASTTCQATGTTHERRSARRGRTVVLLRSRSESRRVAACGPVNATQEVPSPVARRP